MQTLLNEKSMSGHLAMHVFSQKVSAFEQVKQFIFDDPKPLKKF